MSNLDAVADTLKGKPAKAKKDKDKLSTGLTLVNLACSGDPDWALEKGYYYLFVGDSQAGKTWLTLQCLAEATFNPGFKNYRLVQDCPEKGSKMDIERYYGSALADRLEEPSTHGPSATLEEFYDNLDDLAKGDRPFIDVLDSEDALDSEQSRAKAEKDKKIRRKKKGRDEDEDDGEEGGGEKIKGSYGDGKAKKNSSGLRSAILDLIRTKSILIVIKQTRDNIGPDAMFGEKKTRSGGKALTFYATLELWFSIRGKIRKSVKGKARVVGTYLKIQVKKNRETGRDRSVVIRFYPTHGFDEVGSNIDFLIEEKHWKGSPTKGTVTAPEFDFDGKQDKLIALIEEQGREQELRDLVVKVWNEIEEQCTVKRKQKYHNAVAK